MVNSVTFFLNGERITIHNPDPTLMLVDYLRSPEVGLTGTKKPCGQGGCGGCTVILSEGTSSHRAINSCLRPICALDGLSVTTIEGTGTAPQQKTYYLAQRLGGMRAAAPSDAPIPPEIEEAMAIVNSEDGSLDNEELVTGMNPVAHKLAVCNGSQCGFCSVGFVMNMSEYLVNHQPSSQGKISATRKEIEEIFDGNLCRCTGYHPILAGMKEFSSEKTDDKALKCQLPKDIENQVAASLPVIEANAVLRTENLRVEYKTKNVSKTWIRPSKISELQSEIIKKPRARLVRGNTSFGIYKEEFLNSDDFIDINTVNELKSSVSVVSENLIISAGTTYSDLLKGLAVILDERKLPAYSSDKESERPKAVNSLHAIWYMSQRTAGRIVRNAASIGGNAMLVLRHIAMGSGEPFPSDLLTCLVGLDAKVEYWSSEETSKEVLLESLIEAVTKKTISVNNMILKSFSVPISGAQEVVLSQKVALREVNSHAIVNITTLFEFNVENKIKKCRISCGGILPYPFRSTKTEVIVQGKSVQEFLDGNHLKDFENEINTQLISENNKKRMSGLPDEGFTDEYRRDVSVSLFYKSLLHAYAARETAPLDAATRSSYISWGRWPTSSGKSVFPENSLAQPIGQPYIKSTALLQTSGRQHYTQDLPVPTRTLNAAFVQSISALGQFQFKSNYSDNTIDIVAHLKNKFPETFIDLVTWKDIPRGGLQRIGMGGDQPIFAGAKVLSADKKKELIPEGRVMYVGQALALVVARAEQDAISIADYVSKHCVDYTLVKWGENTNFPTKPILSIDDAIKNGSIFPDHPESMSWISHIWRVTRAQSALGWAKRPTSAVGSTWPFLLSGTNCSITETTQYAGGQAHFYMETQSCIAEPSDDGMMIVRPSSQSPMEMHQSVAMALGIQHNHVSVEVSPLGGGFGGKTEQARFVTAAAAVAAWKMKRPVRIAMPRDEDTAMVGKRHAYKGTCQVAIDLSNKKILGLNAELWGDGGAFYDCSFIVSNCIQLRTDNAYNIPNFQTQIDVCRTNTAPSTAMRSFGDIQAKVIIESAIENAAIDAKVNPDDVRVNSFYQEKGDTTPFGQAITNCYIKKVWDYLKENAKYEDWKKSVNDFNKKNKWRKRGLAMLPVKYGSGYNTVLLEQATAVLSVNSGDGSVVIHQGGVEMGQGLITQARQVAAQTLNIPMEMIRLEIVRTSVIPNPTSSGASTGTPYACEVTKLVCRKFVDSLSNFIKKEQLSAIYSPDKWHETATNGKLKWQSLIETAYVKRHELVQSVTHRVKGGEASVKDSLTFKPQGSPSTLPDVPIAANAPPDSAIDSFVGFTYSVGCSEVEVDILTGETKIIRSEVVYDMGKSLNPALDIGQVEGAFVQGAGYLTSEMLAFEKSGDEAGRLNATNTWRYKIPSSACIPQTFNVYLFPREGGSVSGDLTTIDSAKEVGEPPLVLAISVFFAIKDAIRQSRLERKLPGIFALGAPATVQEIRNACQVSTSDLKLV